jgi:isocitrate/isopropylmalate dehydrogenase
MANPTAAIDSAALMLRWSFGEEAAASALEAATAATLERGPRTRDLGGEASTDEVTGAVLRVFAQAPVPA